MAKKYYAVRVGKIPGIYLSWADCKSMVEGYPGAKYKGFDTITEAEYFLQGVECVQNADVDDMMVTGDDIELHTGAYAFVDGSYNVETGVYGYGGFLVVDGEKYILQGSGNEDDMASMRNVAGEILGSMAAIEKALELGINDLVIYYDYLGIEKWAMGEWKRNKTGTIAYYEFIQRINNHISIAFIKVKGHSGIEGNEEADRLAKEAVGIDC